MYNNILQTPNFYKVAMYIRLSKEDDDKRHRREAESESVTNQRNLLLQYVKDCGFTLIDEYIDDGYTGTNFDRPAFKRMLEDIETGKINTIITKDLSRLGRDYIKTGHYIEQYFPLKKVRYISILDNIDTFLDTANNDIAPFKALFNDMASKDTSKKIRSILKDKKEKGKFIGSNPCYGYMRDPLDKSHLITDPITAPVVRKIFQLSSNGVGLSEITTILNSEKIKTPSAYKNIKNSSRQINNDLWTISSVNKILINQMYVGDMVQNVQTKLNYKSKKKVALDRCFWVIVENTHEPLVDRETFMAIQNKPMRKRITFKDREKRLLENLIYCKECGNSLGVVYSRSKDYWTVNCNKYARDPRRGFCMSHFLVYNKFEKEVLEKVKITCEKYLKKVNVKKLAKDISNEFEKENDSEDEKKLLRKKTIELQQKIDTLYEDKFNGIVSAETYIRLSQDSENYLKQMNSRLKELDEIESKKGDLIQELKSYESEITKLIDFKNPTRELLQTIIDKIVVDKDKNIQINYKFKIIQNDDFKLEN